MDSGLLGHGGAHALNVCVVDVSLGRILGVIIVDLGIVGVQSDDVPDQSGQVVKTHLGGQSLGQQCLCLFLQLLGVGNSRLLVGLACLQGGGCLLGSQDVVEEETAILLGKLGSHVTVVGSEECADGGDPTLYVCLVGNVSSDIGLKARTGIGGGDAVSLHTLGKQELQAVKGVGGGLHDRQRSLCGGNDLNQHLGVVVDLNVVANIGSAGRRSQILDLTGAFGAHQSTFDLVNVSLQLLGGDDVLQTVVAVGDLMDLTLGAGQRAQSRMHAAESSVQLEVVDHVGTRLVGVQIQIPERQCKSGLIISAQQLVIVAVQLDEELILDVLDDLSVCLLLREDGIQRNTITQQLADVQNETVHGRSVSNETVFSIQLCVGQIAVGLQIAEENVGRRILDKAEVALGDCEELLLQQADDRLTVVVVLALHLVDDQHVLDLKEGLQCEVRTREGELHTGHSIAVRKSLTVELLDLGLDVGGALVAKAQDQGTALLGGLDDGVDLGQRILDLDDVLGHAGDRAGQVSLTLLKRLHGSGQILGSSRLICLDCLQIGIRHAILGQRSEEAVGQILRGSVGNARATCIVAGGALDHVLDGLAHSPDVLAGLGHRFALHLLQERLLVALEAHDPIELLLEVTVQLVGIGYADAAEEVVINDEHGLQILHLGIQLVVDLNHVVEPNVVTDRIVLAQVGVVLQILRVLVGQRKIHRSAVLNSLQLGVIQVALHVQGGSREVHVAVQHDAQEGHAVAGGQITGGINGCAQDMVDVLPRVGVTAVNHDLQLVLGVGDKLQCLRDEALCVLAVVRLILVEVGVQSRAERAYRNTAHVVVRQVLLHELGVEMLEICRGDGQLIIALVPLLGRHILTLVSITVVDGTDRMLSHREAVKELGSGGVREVKVGIDTQPALALGCRIKQLLHGHSLGHGLLPLQTVGDGGIHTAVGKARQLEVDVGNALLGKLLIHGVYVLGRGQGSLDLHGDGEDLFHGLHSAEGLDIQRNVVRHRACIQCRQLSLFDQTVTVGHRHTQPAGLVAIALLDGAGLDSLSRQSLVSQQGDVDLVAADVLTVGDHGHLGVVTDGNSVSKVVFVARTGVAVHRDGIVLVQGTCMGVGQSRKCLALLDHSGKAALLDALGHLCVLNEISDCLQVIRKSIRRVGIHRLLDDVIRDGVDGGHDVLTEGLVVLNEIVVHGVLHDTVDGIGRHLLIFHLQVVVCVVLAVDLGGDGLTVGGIDLHVLKGEQCARAVGEEGVSLVVVVTCTQEGQDLQIVDLERRLVEADTVGGQTDGKAGLVNGILQRHLEQRRILLLAGVLGLLMVEIHLLVGVVGAGDLDDLLDLLDLVGRHRGLQNVDVHVLQNGVHGQHVLLHGFGHGIVQRLALVVVDLLMEVECLAIHGVREILVLNDPLGFLVGNAVVFAHRIEDQRLEAALLNGAGDEASCLLASDGVLDAKSVFDVLDLDLILSSGLLEAVVDLLVVVADLGKGHDDLRHQLVFNAFGRRGIADVVGVGKEDLTRGHILDRHLARLLVGVDGVVPLRRPFLHGGELLFRRLILRGMIVRRSRLGVVLLLGRRRSRCAGSSLLCRYSQDGKSGQRTAQHQNRQEERHIFFET